jgi:hypothetical protein
MVLLATDCAVTPCSMYNRIFPKYVQYFLFNKFQSPDSVICRRYVRMFSGDLVDVAVVKSDDLLQPRPERGHRSAAP